MTAKAKVGPFAAVVLGTLLFAKPVAATEKPIEGGSGGGFFQVKCDGYVTGFEGQTGAYVDHFRLLCASWDPATRTLQNRGALPISVGTSQTGGPAKAACPDGWAIRSVDFTMTFGEKRRPAFVHHINFVCVSLTGGEQIARTYGPTKLHGGEAGFPAQGRFIPHTYYQECGAGELAVGFRGRSGLYVDALGLVCAAAPAAPRIIKPRLSEPAPQPEPRMIKPRLGRGKASEEPTAAVSGEGFTGTWNTRTDKNWTYTMTLVQQGRAVTGSYVAQNGSNGRIIGRVGANIMEFTWEQDGGFKGSGRFALAPDGKSFTGTYQGEPDSRLTDPRLLQGSWNGTRR